MGKEAPSDALHGGGLSLSKRFTHVLKGSVILKNKFVRFFALLLVVCFCCCVCVQPMSASAFFRNSSSDLDMVMLMIYYYYLPFFDFNGDDSLYFEFIDFQLGSYLYSSFPVSSDIASYVISCFDGVIISDSSILYDSVAIDFLNGFSGCFYEFFLSLDVDVGDSFDFGDGSITYVSSIPQYDLDGLWGPSSVFLIDNGENVSHLVVSPVSDSLSYFVSSVGNVALISVGVGVVLLACYVLIRLIRRIL